MEEIPGATHLPADFTLENLATIAYASTMWNKSNAATFFDFHEQVGSQKYIKQMVKEKEKELKKAFLPRIVTDRILCTFKFMGQRVSLWSEYSTQILQFPRDVAASLHWTVFGSMDERKIILSSVNSKDYACQIPLEAIYYTACSNAMIEYIKIHWKKILTFCEIYSLDDKFLGLTPSGPKIKFITCSVIFLGKLESSQLFPSQTHYFQDFNFAQTENMFQLAVEEGCPIASQYYWTQLNATEKISGLLFAANCSLAQYSATCDYFRSEDSGSLFVNSRRTFSTYKTKCYADIFMFAITRMSEDASNEYFTSLTKDQIFDILDMLMCHWHSDEFVPLVFDLILKYCSDESDCRRLLRRLLDVMNVNNILGLRNKQSFLHRKLFIALWKKLRSYTNWEQDLNSDHQILRSIFRVFDLEILNLLINTDSEEEHIKSFISIGYETFIKLIEGEEYELFEKFVSDVLKSKKILKWFRVTYLEPFCRHFTIRDRFDVVDKLFDFMYPNLKQRKDFKKRLHASSLCARFICENRIHLADKFLKWWFDSEEEKQNYISDFMGYEIRWVYYVWDYDNRKFQDNTRKVLLWLLQSEDEVNRFKIEKLSSEKALQKFFVYLFDKVKRPSANKYRMFDIVEGTLQFCLSPENITILKQKIDENIHEWVSILGSKTCLHLADDFLGWIWVGLWLGNKTQHHRREIFKRLLKNNDLWLSLDTDQTKRPKCLQEVLSSWVRWLDAGEVDINLDEQENSEHPFLCKAVVNILIKANKSHHSKDDVKCNYIYRPE